MLVLKCALPLCVLFLCAAGDASQGVCDNKKCSAFFLESLDYAKAAKRCEVTGGAVYDVGIWGNIALSLPHGHFWIKAAPVAVRATDSCWSAEVTSEGVRLNNRTCGDTLDGIVCQYTSTCKALITDEAALVNYTSVWVYERQTMFPPGTVAVVRAPDHLPISKHLCAGTQWMRAPWNCEVMNGGCEHQCSMHTCSCPRGHILLHNKFTCKEDPCATCTGLCVETGGKFECRCEDGFKLGPEGSCVDVDECVEDRTLCPDEGEECVNTEGSYKCTCQEGELCEEEFCSKCEHYCDKVQMRCTCGRGFRVDPQDPTKCEEFCDERDCPADCPSPNTCYCPQGYIQDQRDTGTVCTDIDECDEDAHCEHHCNNTWGSYFCVCEEGFQLEEDEHSCVPLEPLQVSGQLRPTAASILPTALPFYVKTGSILGITVFALLCAALLYFLVHKMFIYCTKIQFYSLKQDMEIFTLQQVSTETYKRLSHDWPFRNDCHRL